MTTGEKIYSWITERHAEGRTVFATTYLRSVKITPKRADCVRLSADRVHCEVQFGRRWDSINGCKITAA